MAAQKLLERNQELEKERIQLIEKVKGQVQESGYLIH